MSTVSQGDQRVREFRSPTETTEGPAVRENRPELMPGKTAKEEEIEVKEEEAEEVVAGGTVAEAVAGAGAIILAIVGLAGVLPGYMFTIGTIVLGAGLFVAAAAVASKYWTLLQNADGGRLTGSELRGGVGAGLVGGLAGIILGILALVGLVLVTLCAIAMIVAGGSLLIGAPSTLRLNRLIVRRSVAHKHVLFFAHEMTSVSAGLQALAGAAGIVLGIVALLSSVPVALVLVSLICMGASLLLSGSALSARMLVSAIG